MECTNNALAFLLLRMQLPSTHRSNVDYIWTGLWPMDWTVDWAFSLQLAENSFEL